jgi:hypothetical protein
MCWSGEASTVLAAVGIGSTAYAALHGEDKRLWLPLGYFSLMEVLQAYTYTVIDDCASPGNQVATLLGYLHIVFQPFLANLISLYFVPRPVREAIEPWVYAIVSVGAVCMLVSVYPFGWAHSCHVGVEIFCGQRICSVSGDWHIAWEINRTVVALGVIPYVLSTFALPVLYGSWRMTLYHAVSGPGLAWLTTGNPNEMAAVWCLYSIGLLLIVAKTRLRSLLHVRRWPLYAYLMQPGRGLQAATDRV